LEELIEVEASLLQDVGKRGALDRAVSWNNELQGFFVGSFLEANVTAPLTDDNPAITA
jgi:hypothetical protein